MSGDMALFFNGVADNSKFISIPHRDDNPTAKRHTDFYLVMSGNTWGKGSHEYSGRDFQDLALMDRFRMCKYFVGYHTELEKALLGNFYAKGMVLRKALEEVGSYFSTRNVVDFVLYLQANGGEFKKAVNFLIQDFEETDKEQINKMQW